MLKKFFRLIKNSFIRISDTNNEVSGIKFFIRRSLLEEKILKSEEMGVTEKKYCKNDIIVSLTTYGRRIHDVCFTIESLMQQTQKANKIILWLDEDIKENILPISLQSQIRRGLTIKYTPDIKSYKKLIPALEEYPEAAIITVDDDVIYDFDFIERFINAYVVDPFSIYAGRLHSMTFDGNGSLKPYAQWEWNTSTSSNRHLFTGVGGVLYPPHSLHSEVFNTDCFMSIAPTADDVWFTAMAKLERTEIKKLPTRSIIGEDYISNDSVQDMALCNINIGKSGKNDEQIKAVFSKYNIYELIR